MSCLQNLYSADMSATGGYPVNIGCVLLTASSRLPSMGSPFSSLTVLLPLTPMVAVWYPQGYAWTSPVDFMVASTRGQVWCCTQMSPWSHTASTRTQGTSESVPPPTFDVISLSSAGGRWKSWWSTIRPHHTISLLLTPLGRLWCSRIWQPHFERFLRSRKQCVAPWVLNALSSMLQALHHWVLWAPTVSSVTYSPGELMYEASHIKYFTWSKDFLFF